MADYGARLLQHDRSPPEGTAAVDIVGRRVDRLCCYLWGRLLVVGRRLALGLDNVPLLSPTLHPRGHAKRVKT